LTEFNANDRKHLVTLQGTPYITVVGLQARLADQKKAVSKTDSTLLQIPDDSNGNVAIVLYKVWVVFKNEDGEVVERGPYTSIGDASPDNVNSKLVSALIRMAETRGYGRSLRVATRAQYTALEELPPDA
jgi:hypothetical protein